MQIKLITANIRYENNEDGIHAWSGRLPVLHKVLIDFSPDILATQEGKEDQIRSLADLLPLKLIADHRPWLSDRMYPCLFVNEQRVKVQASGDIWLSEFPHIIGSSSFDSAFPRLCTWMHVTYLSNGKDYIVINTHLDHVLEKTRIEQINVLIKEVKLINTNNLPIILMGDFNDPPMSCVYKTILEKLDLKDPWIELAKSEESSHHAFRGNQSQDGARIDWILVPHNFRIQDIILEKKSLNNIFPSDHYPLVATLTPS